MQRNEQSGSDEVAAKITFRQEAYPGICNFCTSKQHSSIDCSFCTVFYHATNLSALPSIAQNNLNPHKGRLGLAIYLSDDPEMCLRFVMKNRVKFPQPILLRIKAMITEIKTVNSCEEVKSISRETFRSQGIQCIKCPYFRVGGRILYQYALYNTDYAVVGWSRIKLSESKLTEQKMDIQEPKNPQLIPLKNQFSDQRSNDQLKDGSSLTMRLQAPPIGKVSDEIKQTSDQKCERITRSKRNPYQKKEKKQPKTKPIKKQPNTACTRKITSPVKSQKQLLTC